MNLWRWTDIAMNEPHKLPPIWSGASYKTEKEREHAWRWADVQRGQAAANAEKKFRSQ